MRIALPAFLILFGTVSNVYADIAAAQDGMPWLKKIASAARITNYAGTFVYQHSNQVETSRIAHYVDASGEYEKLETLDGPAREIIRSNDRLTCYLPETKTVVIEQRGKSHFPVLLPEQWSSIAENYVLKKGEHDRVAGYDCQMVALEPKDNLRYGRKFCVELTSGLPLRARTYNDKNEMVESFAFTEFTIGKRVTKDMLRSRYAGKSQSWRVDKSALERTENNVDTGWTVRNQPPGFKKLTELKRSSASGSTPISHLVYSDGLAAISVFIEPMPKTPPPVGASYQGAVNIYVKTHNDQMVTVVGETPARTVKQIAESLQMGNR